MMKRTIMIISGIVVVIAIIVVVVISKANAKKNVSNLFVESMRGQFDIIVTTTGELQAKNSTDILGPNIGSNRNFRATDIKITDIVPEGTEVKKGDYIATLDKTTFDNNLKDELDKLTTYESNLEMKILDTAVTLSNYRDQIKNLRSSVDEAQIIVDQSKYEPPTTQRQAVISLEQAKRTLDQNIKSYALQVERAKSDMRNTKMYLSDEQQRVQDIQNILTQFVITAPSDGMIIYKRDRTGTKRKIGSSITGFDNVVATLPDMSSMISKTFVNEIDVSKVKIGQKVQLIVDAFPEKKYTGSVIYVANIGEQLPSADAKVFEVQIEVDGSDPILKPSMTTGNKIITQTLKDVTYIPLESVQLGADSVPFVYQKNGKKQIIVLGESNENYVVVEQGLEAGVPIYLSTPASPDGFKLSGEELIAVNIERAKAKKAEEDRKMQEAERAKLQRGNPMMNGGTGMMNGGGGAGMMNRGGAGGGMNITPEMMQQFQSRQGQGMGQGTQGMGQGAQGMGQGRVMDTAAMRRFQQGGGMRDTSARRRTNRQPAQEEN
jgi:HlyD family secretion protein